jgi:NTE family protein
MVTRALVLGGGGVTGVAWEIGMLLGLEEAGIPLRDADRLVGTSAGSIVAANIAGPTALADLYRAQVEGFAGATSARLRPVDIVRLLTAVRFARNEQQGLRKLGALAAAAKTEPAAARRTVIEQRLPSHEWPDRDLRIPAVDIDSGELRVFERDSGVELVDAVGASCAVPMVWPVVPIDGHRYMDGGVRSVANADLAAGLDRVIVIAPQTRGMRTGTSVAEQVAALGVPSVVVSPDDDARKALGRNALDPAARRPSAEAGRAQAARVADDVRKAWG